MAKARQTEAEQARDEIAKREADLVVFDQEAADARQRFETDPTPERFTFSECAAQLARNARTGLELFRGQCQAFLAAERLELDRARMHELVASLHFDRDAQTAASAVASAVESLVESLRQLHDLKPAADAHNAAVGQIEGLAIRTGETVTAMPASYRSTFAALVSRLVREYGPTDDQGHPTESGVELRVRPVSGSERTFSELTVRVPQC